MMRKNINRNYVFTLDENDIPIVSIIDEIIKLNHQNHYSLFIQEMKFIQLFIH